MTAANVQLDGAYMCICSDCGGQFTDDNKRAVVCPACRVEDDATLKAMREMRDADPWVTDQFSAEGAAGRHTTYNAPGRACRYCECTDNDGHASDCPWLLAQEDET